MLYITVFACNVIIIQISVQQGAVLKENNMTQTDVGSQCLNLVIGNQEIRHFGY